MNEDIEAFKFAGTVVLVTVCVYGFVCFIGFIISIKNKTKK